MKECLNCRIKVGGQVEVCPLCQNSLSGEAGYNPFPAGTRLKKQAFWYRLQMFVVLSLVVVGLTLDLVMDLYRGFHWSLIVAMWGIVFELVFHNILKRSVRVSSIITIAAFYIILLSIITGWYLDVLIPVVNYGVPVFVMGVLIAELVFFILDKKENAFVYLLGDVAVGVIASVVLGVVKKASILWDVCMMVSVIILIATICFRGKRMWSELQKRFNF